MSAIPAHHQDAETFRIDPTAETRERLAQINGRIAAACARAGRSASEVTLVAVGKTVSAERICAAIQCGVHVVGENRVQEAADKIPRIAAATTGRTIDWRLIGHLQSNKARRGVELFTAIDSVDSYKLAERLDRLAGEIGRRLPILIEVNLGGESSKSGLDSDDVLQVVQQIHGLSNLELKGLMTVPPYLDPPEEARPYFRRLRELRDASRSAAGEGFNDLSMGMSNDFEIAIEEGATMVRIGTALFGPRQD